MQREGKTHGPKSAQAWAVQSAEGEVKHWGCSAGAEIRSPGRSPAFNGPHTWHEVIPGANQLFTEEALICLSALNPGQEWIKLQPMPSQGSANLGGGSLQPLSATTDPLSRR